MAASRRPLMQELIDAINEGDLAKLAPHIAPGFTRHDLVHAYPELGGSQVTDVIQSLRAGVEGLHLSIDHVIESGDEAAVWLTLRGKHTGSVFGVQGKGQPIEVHGVNRYRFDGEQIVETWQLWDVYGVVTASGGG